MSILQGLYNYEYLSKHKVVDLKQFNTFSELQKGQFLIKQYAGLIELFAFKINYESLLSTIEDDSGLLYKFFNTSHPILKQWMGELAYLYKTWKNQINKNDPLNKKMLSIIQWLRGETHLDPSNKYADILYFLEISPFSETSEVNSNTTPDRNYEKNTTLLMFFMMSRLYSCQNGDITFDEIPTIFPSMYSETYTIKNGYLGRPYIHTPVCDNVGDLTAEEKDPMYIYMLNENIFSQTKFTIPDIINRTGKTILELVLLSSTIKTEVNLNCLVYLFTSFDIGYSHTADGYELAVKQLSNIVWNDIAITPVYQSGSCEMFGSMYNGTFIDLLNLGSIKADMNDSFYKTYIKPKMTDTQVSTISTESFNLLNKVDRLIHRITMEDEETGDEPEADEEVEEDNIDENSDDSSMDDFSDSDFDSGSSEGDDSFSDSGSSMGGGDKPPIEVPKNINANTSSSSGIKLELDVNPTLDSVIVKKELLVFMDNILMDQKLSSKQRVTLESIKGMWLGLLTPDTIIDWLQRTLNRTIFKKS